MARKDLVYWSVGGEPGYASLLRESMESVIRHVPRERIHTLVMCDEDFAREAVEPLVKEGIADEIWITKKNTSVNDIARRRLELSEVRDVKRRFRRALYLDCDAVVVNDLLPILDHPDVDRYPTVIHGVPERHHPILKFQNHSYFGYGEYTERELMRLLRRGTYGSNCGQFLIQINNATLRLLDEARDLARERGGFMDQGALNTVANLRAALRPTLDEFVALSIQQKPPSPRTHVITHIIGGIPYEKKLTAMKWAQKI